MVSCLLKLGSLVHLPGLSEILTPLQNLVIAAQKQINTPQGTQKCFVHQSLSTPQKQLNGVRTSRLKLISHKVQTDEVFPSQHQTSWGSRKTSKTKTPSPTGLSLMALYHHRFVAASRHPARTDSIQRQSQCVSEDNDCVSAQMDS